MSLFRKKFKDLTQEETQQPQQPQQSTQQPQLPQLPPTPIQTPPQIPNEIRNELVRALGELIKSFDISIKWTTYIKEVVSKI